jgi:hypothetical protein
LFVRSVSSCGSFYESDAPDAVGLDSVLLDELVSFDTGAFAGANEEQRARSLLAAAAEASEAASASASAAAGGQSASAASADGTEKPDENGGDDADADAEAGGSNPSAAARYRAAQRARKAAGKRTAPVAGRLGARGLRYVPTSTGLGRFYIERQAIAIFQQNRFLTPIKTQNPGREKQRFFTRKVCCPTSSHLTSLITATAAGTSAGVGAGSAAAMALASTARTQRMAATIVTAGADQLQVRCGQ